MNTLVQGYLGPTNDFQVNCRSRSVFPEENHVLGRNLNLINGDEYPAGNFNQNSGNRQSRTMSSAISQLSCFSAVVDSRRLQLHQRSRLCPTKFRPGKVLNVMNGDGHGPKLSQLENKNVEDASASYNGSSVQPHSAADSFVAGAATNEQESIISQPKRAAMIHDFCFGIPFGGLVFSGGLVGFLVSKNPRTLMSGVLYGGALLTLSTLSLKVWRQGKPSFPFILGQAVLSLALLFKHSRAYTLTNKLFPTAFNVVISAAMLCFYAYVMISGGNPPPKKLKPTAAVESS